MKKYILICLSLFCFVMPILAETTSSSTFPPDTTVAQQAIASPDYIVTAGDIYALAMDGTVISVTIDASYKLRVGNLGVINVKGLTFQQLKNKVENLVNSNYPTANFQFYITNPASFKVLITGEVVVSGEVDTWSLKRLSTLIQNYLTPYSSTRIIVIESEDGTKKTYDLFQAKRYGDMSQDPYLRPNDKIIISEYDRIVTVKGEVKRPGTYELLPEEQIQDLINVYGGGYTDFANKSEMILTRFIGGEQVWEQKNLVEADFVADKVLFSRDVVQVLSHSLTRNAFFVLAGFLVCSLIYNIITTESTGWEFVALIVAAVVIVITRRFLGIFDDPRDAFGRPLPLGDSKEEKRKRNLSYFLESLIFAVICTGLDVALFAESKESIEEGLLGTAFEGMNFFVFLTVIGIVTFVVTFVISFSFEYVVNEKARKKFNEMMSDMDEDENNLD